MKKALFLTSLALATMTGAAVAQENMLFDYRDADFRMGQAFYSASDRQRLVTDLEEAAPAELGKDLGADFAIVGDAAGIFSAGGTEQRIYLLQSKLAVAIEPFPDAAPPVLAVLGGDKARALFRLPADVQYQRVIGAADVTGDGISEVMLESSFMNMGQLVISVDVFDLSGEAPVLLQTLPEVYADSCENPTGEKAIKAATITLGANGRLIAETHTLPCSN